MLSCLNASSASSGMSYVAHSSGVDGMKSNGPLRLGFSFNGAYREGKGMKSTGKHNNAKETHIFVSFSFAFVSIFPRFPFFRALDFSKLFDHRTTGANTHLRARQFINNQLSIAYMMLMWSYLPNPNEEGIGQQTGVCKCIRSMAEHLG